MGSGKKNEVAVLVLSFVSQMVMPKVFQCDLEAVKRLVAGLEADPTSVTSQELVQAIIDERCDGGKNFQTKLYILFCYFKTVKCGFYLEGTDTFVITQAQSPLYGRVTKKYDSLIKLNSSLFT